MSNKEGKRGKKKKKNPNGCGTNQRGRGKKKKEERRAETWHAGTRASSKQLLGLKTCQPEGCGMVPIPAFINASYTQSLIYGRLTADILQVPSGTSEDRRNLREITCPGSSLKGKSPPVQGNNLVAFFFYGVCWGLATDTEPVGSDGCWGRLEMWDTGQVDRSSQWELFVSGARNVSMRRNVYIYIAVGRGFWPCDQTFKSNLNKKRTKTKWKRMLSLSVETIFF